MKVLFVILIIMGTIWVLLTLLWALAAGASGHNVPSSTFVTIAIYAGVGIFVIIGCSKALKKVRQ